MPIDFQRLARDSRRTARYPGARVLLPWLPFFAILLWSWRSIDLFLELPGGSDNYEVLWGISWFSQAFSGNPLDVMRYDLLFHPEGWMLANFAVAPVTILPFLPFHWLAGPAFALNGGYLLAVCVTYAGTYKMARVLGGSIFAAILAGLLYTFWGNRWFRLYGHANLLLGGAMLPWMIWSLERANSAANHKNRWLLLVALLWALSILSSLYFIWLGGLAILAWIGVRILSGDVDKRRGVIAAAMITVLSLLLSMPYILFYWQGTQISQVSSRTISELNDWGASVNSLVVPFVGHPFLAGLSRSIYTGPVDESGVANFGPIVLLILLASIPAIWRRRQWRPLVALALSGLILALGITLKWNGNSLLLPWLRPLNELIWQAGQTLKPALFQDSPPPESLLEAIPLPGMIAATVVPFWDSARVSARFALVAGIGIYMAAALGVSMIKSRWIRAVLAILLIIEVFPFTLSSQAFPPKPHPAFEWLESNTAPNTGIVDVQSQTEHRLALKMGGETLMATSYHNRPTASGASSVWPAHSAYLREWLLLQKEPLRSDGFAEVMRAYAVRFVVLHMDDTFGPLVLTEVEDNPELKSVGCFPAAEAPTIWAQPICLIEILPSSYSYTNLILGDGWSDKEDWGVWAEGVTAQGQWIATAQVNYRLLLEAFPHCVNDLQQEVSIVINEEVMASHRWKNCDAWMAAITIPASYVTIGENKIAFEYSYAISPADASDGQNGDPRPLSAGYSTLRIERE